MKKQEAIKEIENQEKEILNRDQKAIAKQIIESLDENKENVEKFLKFILLQKSLHLEFGSEMELNNNIISVPKEIESKRINVDNTKKVKENKVIIGSTNKTLKALNLTHRDKIKIVFYNAIRTHNESFESYSNELKKEKLFKKNGWLYNLNSNLKIVKNLLEFKTGALFIMSNDSDQAYIKMMCDSLLGKNSFMGCIPVPTIVSNINKLKFNYVLVYSKCPLKLSEKFVNWDRFNKEDDRGFYELVKLTSSVGNTKSASGKFEVILEGKSYFPDKHSPAMRWKWSKKRINCAIALNMIVPPNSEDSVTLYYKRYKNLILEDCELLPYKEEESVYVSFFTKEEFKNSLTNCNEEIDEKKSVELIKRLISIINDNDTATILDIFNCKSIVNKAVLQLNNEDDGTRKTITCILNNQKLEEFNANNQELFSKENFRFFELENINIGLNSSQENLILLNEEDLTDFRSRIVENLKFLNSEYKEDKNDFFYKSLLSLRIAKDKD